MLEKARVKRYYLGIKTLNPHSNTPKYNLKLLNPLEEAVSKDKSSFFDEIAHYIWARGTIPGYLRKDHFPYASTKVEPIDLYQLCKEDWHPQACATLARDFREMLEITPQKKVQEILGDKLPKK